GKAAKLTPVEIYKGCVVAANNGWRRPEESHLGQYQRALLEARRKIKCLDLDTAASLVSGLKVKSLDSPIDGGDRAFLKGIIFDRLGENRTGAEWMAKAAQAFSDTNDQHRY